MKVADIVDILEKLAPKSNAESFDNIGLLTGSLDEKVTGVLVTLDCLEQVVDEAIQKKCTMIVTFHPIIFSGLKSITGKNYVERTVIKAIKNNISIYAIHTNLDIAKEGVNYEISNRLQLKNTQPLIPKNRCIKKLVTYIPTTNFSEVQQALFKVGAGEIGNYTNCSFSIEGKGSFLPTENSNPFLGEINKLEQVKENMLGVVFEDYKQSLILKALKASHPYEEVAYEIYTLDNENQELGMGRVGDLENEISEEDFLNKVKQSLPTQCIRHTALRNKPVKKVAVLGGSGSFAIKNAVLQKADVYITADIKYHEFFKAEGNILLMDIGHYESEQFTKDLLHQYLKKNTKEISIYISQTNTNPIFYY